MDVIWHDGHAFGVDGAEISVLEETDKVRLVKRSTSAALENSSESTGDLRPSEARRSPRTLLEEPARRATGSADLSAHHRVGFTILKKA